MRLNNIFKKISSGIKFLTAKVSYIVKSHRQNGMYLLFSFAIAGFLWYGITDRSLVEAEYRVRLEYRNLPSHLVITDGMQDTVSIRLRGLAQSFSGLANKNLTYAIDLSKAGKGLNNIELDLTKDSDLKPFEIITVKPHGFVLVCDEWIEEEVLLEPVMIRTQIQNEFNVTTIELEPSKVVVRGAAKRVNPITRILVPFTPDTDATEGKYREFVQVEVPPNVEVEPSAVRITYELEKKNKVK